MLGCKLDLFGDICLYYVIWYWRC